MRMARTSDGEVTVCVFALSCLCIDNRFETCTHTHTHTHTHTAQKGEGQASASEFVAQKQQEEETQNTRKKGNVRDMLPQNRDLVLLLDRTGRRATTCWRRVAKGGGGVSFLFASENGKAFSIVPCPASSASTISAIAIWRKRNRQIYRTRWLPTREGERDERTGGCRGSEEHDPPNHHHQQEQQEEQTRQQQITTTTNNNSKQQNKQQQQTTTIIKSTRTTIKSTTTTTNTQPAPCAVKEKCN
jgi:hypothetical protein